MSVLADVALYLWIAFTLVLFFVMRPLRAALWSIVGGVLYLPMHAEFTLPMMPAFTKDTLPYVMVLIGCTIRCPGRVWRLPEERWVLVVAILMIVGGIGTGLTNGDALVYGTWHKKHIAGLTIKDGLYPAVFNIFNSAIPFFLGAALVRERRDLEDTLTFMAGAGLVYSLFALYEVRMSPQLHRMVYGYMQHEFGQTMREGGYRPMVFMAHGLALALFLVVCLLSAIAVRRARRRIMHISSRVVAVALGAMVVVVKSSGALIYAVVAAPLMLFTSPKVQQRVALVLGILVLVYPALRQADLFPTQSVLQASSSLGEERKASLQFRFMNEDLLLKKANQRLLFGWGQYDRNQIFDGGGHVATVTDGAWIIVLGVSGMVGFLTVFGLLVLPIFLTGPRLRRVVDPADKKLVAAMCMIVGVTAIDLLPNGLFHNYPFFLSGALLSVSRWARRWEPVAYAAPAPALPAEQAVGVLPAR